MTRHTRAAMPWAIITVILVFGFGVIVLRVFDPYVTFMLDTAAGMSDREAGSDGIAIVRLAWNYWPIWFTGMLLIFGYVEAHRRSSPGRP